MNYTAPPELLNNKVILITGAGAGIGAAVAKACACHGASVILLDKNVPALEQVYDDIVANNVATPALYPLDLIGASIPDYDALSNIVQDSFGRLDGLIHCAASLGQLSPVQQQDPKTWLETMHINLSAPYFLTRACLSLMKNSSPASIIFTTDCHKNKAYWAGYGVAKAGIEALSKQLADELENGRRIRVNCIDPGAVKTNLHTRTFPALDPTSLPEPNDIVATYLYLIGADSTNINGELLQAQ